MNTHTPRLYMSSGLWHCSDGTDCGIGYTTVQAYADWLRLLLDRMLA